MNCFVISFPYLRISKMKISVIPIIKDHFRSLSSFSNKLDALVDCSTFFIAPAFLGFVAYHVELRLDRESYNASITFFGIFIALLLNIQVAIFSIYQRKWEKSDDDILNSVQNDGLETRRQLLEELNSNTSYEILVCCLALVMAIVSYITKTTSLWISSISISVYSHFLLTLLMIVKRSHALFQREYRKDN